MKYFLTLTTSVRKELFNLPDIVIKRIDQVIIHLAENPRPHRCTKLKGIDSYRIRVGDYRIIYDINDSLRKITILSIGHRREIYR